MQVLERTDYFVDEVVSDNVLLAQDSQGEYLLLYGSGIGADAVVGETFQEFIRIEDAYAVNPTVYKRMLRRIDRRIVSVCENAIHLIHAKLEEKLDPQIHISLTQHIAAMTQKLGRREGIHYPALVQTEILYHEEFQLAKMVIPYLEKELGMEIPIEEAGFIALYIYGARDKADRPFTIRYAYLANTVTEYLEYAFRHPLEKDSLDYVRLVTHLRFAIERVMSSKAVQNLLLAQIKEEYALAFEIATQAAKILERELGCIFPDDEIGFLALYVEQLRVTS